MTTKTVESIYRTPEGEKAILAMYEGALARWPVPCQTMEVPTRYGKTFVVDSGSSTASAPPLVLLHGAGTNSAIWIGDVSTYTSAHRVIAIDLLGEAGKSAQTRPAWDSPAYAEWLDEVFDALKLTTASVVGISQGGWTALKYAVYKPERISNLVLICPGGVIPDRISFVFRAIFYAFMGKSGAEKMTRMIYADQPLPPGADEISALIMKHFKSRVGVLPIFTDAELKRLTMPTLLLGGAKDALRDNVKIGARLQTLMPQTQVQIVAGGGHALMNTTPLIMPFLAQHAVQLQHA